MKINATVVYYTEHDSVDVFHVEDINTFKLQIAFNDATDMYSIKFITLEYDTFLKIDRHYRTLFTEQDVKDFLDDWKLIF